MSKEILRKIRIFAASPSDVAIERAKLETVVSELIPLANHLDVSLEVMDWRKVIPNAGRPQQVIFDQLQPTSWDIFIGILWHRFGTPPGKKDPVTQRDYLSGMEEEFRVAYALQKQYGKPRMMLYRCTRPIPYEADFKQAQTVKRFLEEVQNPRGDYPLLMQSFDTVESFEKLALKHLQMLLCEYGEQAKMPITPDVMQVLVPSIPNNLPRRAPFFGRVDEMNEVMRALSSIDRTWGIIIDGIGGIGKTSLAVEAAYCAQTANAFDAFVFVTAKQSILVPEGIREQTPAARTLDEFLNETARILGEASISKLATDEKRLALLQIIRMRRVLIIYDNLETLSKAEQETVADFLRELPQGSKAIITSRRRGGEGSVWLRLGKLDWEAAKSIIKNELSRDKNLAEKLQSFESSWQELYDETNGSPLALVHILGILRVRTALNFKGALAMLRRAPGKEALMKFIYEEACKELTSNDKIALSALSFFVPSAKFSSWMQVSDLSRNALETTIERLSALSLVDIQQGEERYSIHSLTRAFVQDDLLVDKKIAGNLEENFMGYWVGFVARINSVDIDSYMSFSLLELEWTNIKFAADWLLQKIKSAKKTVNNQQAERLIRLLTALTISLDDFLLLGGQWDTRKEMNANIYELALAKNDADTAGYAAYSVAWVDLTYGRNLPDKAKPWVDRCVKIWSKSEDDGYQREAIRLRGLLSMQYKRYKVAERHLLIFEKGMSHIVEPIEASAE